MHYHRRPYRWITVRRHFIENFTGNATITDEVADELHSVSISQIASLEMPQSPTTLQTDSFRRHFTKSGGNAILTDDLADRVQSVGICRQFTITDKFIDGWYEFQMSGIKCISNRMSLPTTLLLNPARPGGSTRWLDRSGFNTRSAVATARPNPGEPERDPVFFFFSNVGFEIH